MFKRIIILAVAFVAIAPAAQAAPTLDTKRAEAAVVAEADWQFEAHSDDVTCERTSARHARCVQRFSIAPACSMNFRWAVQLSRDGGFLALKMRTKPIYVGNGCPVR